MNILSRLFTPPVFENSEKSQKAAYIHYLLLIVMVTATAIGVIDFFSAAPETLPWVLLGDVFLLGALWTNHRGHTNAATTVFLLSLLFTVTQTIINGQGIHDIGITVFPVVLMISSFLVNRKNVWVWTGLTLLILAVIVFGDILGYFPEMQKRMDAIQSARTADFFIVGSVILVGAILVQMQISLIQRSSTEARQNALAYAQSNELLRASEAMWRALVDSAPNRIFLVKRDGEIAFSNDPTVRTSQNSFFEMIPGEEQQMAHEFIQNVFTSRKAGSYDGQIWDGKQFRWYGIQAAPLISHEIADINELIVIASDIQKVRDTLDALEISRETEKKRAEQLATLTEIGRAVSSQSSTEKVMETAYEQLRAILPMDAFFICLYERDKNLVTYPFMLDHGQKWEEEPSVLLDGTLMANTIQQNKPQLLNRKMDQTIPRPRLNEPDSLSRISASIMMAPLQIGDQAIGAISTQSYQRNAYSESDLTILSAAAHQIAIAIHNARLYEEIQKRAEQLEIFNKIGRSVSRLSELPVTLKIIFDHISAMIPLDVFFVALYNPEKNTLTFPFMYDAGKMWDEPESPITDSAWSAKVIQTHKPILLNRTPEEIAQDALTLDRIGDQDKISASILIAPIEVGEKVIGVVSAHSYTINAYNEEHLSLLNGASNQVGIAIENARLYDQLQKELAERQRAENEVRELNAQLEQRVQQRTQELQTANQELESFTYTVSHDLRSPLRGINGYSRILAEDYASQLPAEAQKYLQRISGSAIRMGMLIDDLLTFSRLGKQPIRASTVDLAALVSDVVNEQIDGPLRNKTNVSIGPLPIIKGDPALLKQVFVNLVANALKYSGHKQQIEIEIGCLQQGNEWIISVRDNGAGFDMTHYNKLFGVFQRLHNPEEFEGTGVGLAIVKRIIEKHGGRIWAQGEVGKGAIFYLALGKTL